MYSAVIILEVHFAKWWKLECYKNDLKSQKSTIYSKIWHLYLEILYDFYDIVNIKPRVNIANYTLHFDNCNLAIMQFIFHLQPHLKFMNYLWSCWIILYWM